MKTIYLTCILTLTVLLTQAQLSGPPDSLNINKEERKHWLKEIKEKKIRRFSDSLATEPALRTQPDTTRYNRYGDLLLDDPAYNVRQPIWKPIAQAAGVNLLFMGYNRFVARADYAYVSPSTWKRNLTTEPEWDTDEFGINFIGHPYQGTLYFNAARSQGYNYWQSLPFAVAGSVTWEYFGENTLPSYNDLVYTPLNGAALGEILYRVSSNILDDRTSGRERVIREVAAGILNPVRGLNRLLQGKTSAVTNTEMYEKEPLNLTILSGVHRLNEKENDVFGEGRTNSMLSVQLD